MSAPHCPGECAECAQANVDLATAVARIANGGVSGPTGLELVAMALNPSVGGPTVTDGLLAVASAVETLAEAVRGDRT